MSLSIVNAKIFDGVSDTLAFSIGNAAKDVGYYVRMTEGLGADTVMARCADTALKEAAGGGMRDRMVPEMVDFYAKRFGG